MTKRKALHESLCRAFAAMVAIAGFAAAAHASSFTITSSTSGSTTRFIVSRSDTNTAETVRTAPCP